MKSQVQIDEEIVKIKVISVSGRKMTKSVFNQILVRVPFDRQVNFIGDKILGVVYDPKSTWLVFIINDELRKFDLKLLYKFSEVNEYTSKIEFDWLEERLRITIPSPDEANGIRGLKDCYSWERWEELMAVVSKAGTFLEQLKGRQIFV